MIEYKVTYEYDDHNDYPFRAKGSEENGNYFFGCSSISWRDAKSGLIENINKAVERERKHREDILTQPIPPDEYIEI